MSPRASDISRRRFIATGTSAMAGLVVAFHVPVRAVGVQAPAGGKPALPDPNAFLRIAPDDTVTILLAHSEMGQGMWTGLAMLVAEELACEWNRIRVEHAPAAPAYFHTAFGNMQATGGSTSIWSEFDRYRQVGALARELLVRAAAEQWGIPPTECRVQNGVVLAGSRRATFGALAEKARSLPSPATVTLKERSAWTIIGKGKHRLDSPEKITGRAIFGQDVRFDGLKVAVVERSPVFGGKVVSFDDAEARKVPGVRAVVQVPSGVAVVADHFYAASEGRRALAPSVKWDLGPGAAIDTEALRKDYRAMAARPGAKAGEKGNVAGALAKAQRRIEAEYEGPFLAHASMEPLNCTVKLTKDTCEIWTGTQFQTADQSAAAKVAGLPPEKVTIHTTFLGGGFGRRANPRSDFVSEAVHVAKASGMPVKVIWTREDDMRGGFYRPQFFHRVQVGVGAEGLPSAWHHTIVCQSLLKGTPFEAGMQDGIDSSSVEGTVDSPYVTDLADYRVDLHTPDSPVTVLWLRSVGHTHTAFVMESTIDELAKSANVDPLEYRRKLLAKHPRHLGVLNLAAEKAGWQAPPASGRGRGIAVHESFGSWVATVAEVSVAGDAIKVHRLVTAIDCGTCVNPLGVTAQIEGAAAFGLSAALYSELTLREGRVQQENFDSYRVLRLSEMPKVETHIVPSTEKPGGVGEPGVPTIAPAVANAVFALTGKRLRRLPLRIAT
jgi:isoquinoline 1-oxidoreductase beta subunit